MAYLMAAGLSSGGATAVLADNSPTCASADLPVVVVRAEGGRPVSPECSGLSKELARSQAREAARQGEHQRAAECYVQAGDHAQANRAYLKAAGRDGAASSQRMASAADDAKLQAHRLRDAFRRR
jgi:hypothetical protein